MLLQLNYDQFRQLFMDSMQFQNQYFISSKLILRIQMIFPKQQMQIEQAVGQELKKQALQLIIQLYLNRKKDEDIAFLKSNFSSTHDFASSVRSCISNGLSQINIQNNRILYGQNEKKFPEKCISLKQCFRRQFANVLNAIGFVLILACIIFGLAKHNQQITKSSLIIMVFQLILSLGRVAVMYYLSYQLQKSSVQKTKNSMYQVIRNGNLIQIEECEIVVGDVVELGFKQKVPATGIIISHKQIFVKQNNKQTALHKMSLELCIKKIQAMNDLQLKLSFQQESLPSPIILRGSELLKGNTYSILVMSVSQQNLLKQHSMNKEDKFSSDSYDQLTKKIVKKWKIWSIAIAVIITIALPFSQFSDLKLNSKNTTISIQLFFKTFQQISTLIFVLNCNPISSFLQSIFLKLMVDIRIIEQFQKFFSLSKILCNEEKIVESDRTTIYQIATCDKMDLINGAQVQQLEKSTSKLISQMTNIFNLSIENKQQNSRKILNCSKITHIYKKNCKIISILSSLQTQNEPIFKSMIKQIGKAQKIPHHCSQLVKKQKQKSGSYNLLKLPKIYGEFQQEQNLKQIIHSRCRTKSRSVLDSLVKLAQKKFRTFYFQQFQLHSLEKIDYTILQGKLSILTPQLKQRMGILAKKLKAIYNLKPFVIGFNEGPYNQRQLNTLVCIVGVAIEEENQALNKLKTLSQMGIQTILLINQNNAHLDKQAVQNQIFDDYKGRRWLKEQNKNWIHDMNNIKQTMKRLVCRDCLIANCDCKDKCEQVSNIQPFIQFENQLGIIYNLNDDGLKFLESAHNQLQNTYLSIHSSNFSAIDAIDSIISCKKFINNLNRSLILFYGITTVFLIVPLIFWIRSLSLFTPLSAVFCYSLIMLQIMFLFLLENKSSLKSIESNEKIIRIVKKGETVSVLLTCIIVIIASQLFNVFHDKIPEFPDHYDDLMQKYSLDPLSCKYSENKSYYSVTNKFMMNQCEIEEIGLQSSRLSTIITVFTFTAVWAMIGIIHRNLRSLPADALYLGTLAIFIIVIQKIPFLSQTYHFGLTWQHYLIAILPAIISVVVGFILGQLISKISILQFFRQETQVIIDFSRQDKINYINELKKYYLQRKWKSLKSNEPKKIFNV